MAGKSPTMIEAAFFPRSLEQLTDLERRLVDEAGESEAAAAGCAMWVTRRALGATGADDGVTPNTRMRYRRMLAKLRQPLEPPKPPTGSDDPRVVRLDQGRRRRPQRDEGGRSTPAASARVAMFAVALVAATWTGALSGSQSPEGALDGSSSQPTAPRPGDGPLGPSAPPAAEKRESVSRRGDEEALAA